MYGIELGQPQYNSLFNEIGVFAYFSLVVGVILQLFSFKYRDSEHENSEANICEPKDLDEN